LNCPQCYSNVRCRGNYKGHRAYKAPRKLKRFKMSEFLKRPPTGGQSPTSSAELCDAEFRLSYPAMYEYVALTSFEDGTARQTSTIYLFTDGGKWKLLFKDRDGSRCFFVTADDLTTALETAERQLQDGRADWRADRPPTAGRGGKR
jgi:hypothetical protein